MKRFLHHLDSMAAGGWTSAKTFTWLPFAKTDIKAERPSRVALLADINVMFLVPQGGQASFLDLFSYSFSTQSLRLPVTANSRSSCLQRLNLSL